MADGNGEDVAGTLKRQYPVKDDTESTAEGANCSLGGRGGGREEEEISEERLSEVQQEVIELAGKVAEYREKGPIAFAQLLEKSLAQMRSSLPLMDTQVNKKSTDAADIEDEVASSSKEVQAKRTILSEGSSSSKESLPTTLLLERLASANETLPTILRDINSCKERLDRAITACRLRQAENSPLPPAPIK